MAIKNIHTWLVASVALAVGIGAGLSIVQFARAPSGWKAIPILFAWFAFVAFCMVAIQAFRTHVFYPAETERRLQIIEANYGVDAGWHVELDGRRVALLAYPRWAEMFWCTYNIEPLTDDADERQQMLTQISWWHNPKLIFRSQKFNRTAPSAFAGGNFDESGRIPMRGLYLFVDDPNLWERIVLYFRRWQKPLEK